MRHPNHFNYIRLDLEDIPTQDLSNVLDPVSEKIISLIKNKKNVFVHCYAGVSRSTSIVINTIMEKCMNKTYNQIVTKFDPSKQD